MNPGSGSQLRARATEPTENIWPTLTSAERCDGENPMTGKPCVNGHHTGMHRDDTDAEWLDNGL
jgi:hypothetical protein